MSLYDESIEQVDYHQMLKDIARNRENLQRSKVLEQLNDRPDLAIDHNGDLWIIAPVSRNYGLQVPIFYRYQRVDSKQPHRQVRHWSADRSDRYWNTRIKDEEPKRSKPKRSKR